MGVQGGDVRASLRRLTVRFQPDPEPYLDARGWAVAGPLYLAALWHPALAAAAGETIVPLPSLRMSPRQDEGGHNSSDSSGRYRGARGEVLFGGDGRDGSDSGGEGDGSVLLARLVRGATGPPKLYWDADVAVASLALRLGPRTPLYLRVRPCAGPNIPLCSPI